MVIEPTLNYYVTEMKLDTTGCINKAFKPLCFTNLHVISEKETFIYISLSYKKSKYFLKSLVVPQVKIIENFLSLFQK